MISPISLPVASRTFGAQQCWGCGCGLGVGCWTAAMSTNARAIISTSSGHGCTERFHEALHLLRRADGDAEVVGERGKEAADADAARAHAGDDRLHVAADVDHDEVRLGGDDLVAHRAELLNDGRARGVIAPPSLGDE